MEHGGSRISAIFNNTSFFRIAYILNLFFCSIGYVNTIAEFGKIFFFVWALSIFINKYLIDNNIKKVSYYGWLLLFIGSNIITLFIQGYGDGIWESMLMVLNMPIIFFLFYGLHSESVTHSGRRRITRELYVLCNIMVVLSLIVNVISLASLYLIGKSISYTFGYLVVYENRFTGIYYNPNLMAFSSFCCMVCCHILSKKQFVLEVSKKPLNPFRKAVTAVSFLLNIAVILLSDSNATMVIMICYAIMTLCYRAFGGKNISFRIIFRRSAALVLSLAIISAGVFFARSLFQTGTTLTMKTEESNTNVFEDKGDELNKITFEHENKNLDSGRIKLLFQGLNVVKHHPIFGVGKGNISKYGNHYNNNQMKYSDFHNGYLTIMVCSGLLGFLIFMMFALCMCKRMTAVLFGLQPPISDDAFPCLFAFVFAYCIYSLFEKTMVFEVSFMITFFWLILGYAAAYMARYEGERYKVTAFTTFEKFPQRLADLKERLHKNKKNTTEEPPQ